jgi:hypothetical protein
MIQGTTPTIAFAFPIEIESLKEFDLTIEQEGKADLTKTQKDFEIDTENNVAYTKLSQEETREFDPRKYVKMQINAVTLDNNVIASQIITDHICPNIKKTNFELETSEITPIDITTFKLDFSQNTCGFNIGFGDMIVYEERPADKQLSSTSTNAVENRVVTENFARVDNEFIKTSKRADEIEAIALGAEKAVSYANYREMVRILNDLPRDYFAEGQGINIVAIEVPDLWVAYRSSENIPYTYTTDKAIIDFISGNGLLQIGYFYLAQKETQKVDLTDYAKKDQVPVINANLKDNGAYTLTITMGVE